jgi:hypothetical protein
MTHWPAQTDPLDLAILDLLCSLPATWRDLDKTGWTATEERALRLMEHAGLVERRDTLRATMVGQPDTVEMVVVLSGIVTKPRIWQELFAAVPGWLDGEDRIRGRLQLAVEAVQIRLTEQGERARHDYKNQTPDNPSVVCSFVRRRGPFAGRPRITPTLRVESCRVETGLTLAPGPMVDAVPAAQRHGNPRPIGVGRSPEQVIKAAETYIKRNGHRWPGVNGLMRICNCGKSTVYDAIKLSPYLQARKAEAKAAANGHSVVGRDGLQAAGIADHRSPDPPAEASKGVDALMARLIESTNATDAEKLKAMSLEQQEEFLRLIREDPESAGGLLSGQRSRRPRDRSRGAKGRKPSE